MKLSGVGGCQGGILGRKVLRSSRKPKGQARKHQDNVMLEEEKEGTHRGVGQSQQAMREKAGGEGGVSPSQRIYEMPPRMAQEEGKGQ